MPTPATAKLPLPKSEDEFEDIVLDAARSAWQRPDLTRHGRRGQRQHGVDLFTSEEPVLAVQCKNTPSLRLADVEAEVNAAGTFQLPISKFVVAIAGPRDAKLQTEVAALSSAQVAKGGFSVEVQFWSDIESAVAGYPALIAKYWGAFLGLGHLTGEETLDGFRKRVFGHLDDFGEYYVPDWYVLRHHPEHGELRSYDFMRLRTFAPTLGRGDFEPEDEDRFAEAIGGLFPCSTPKVVPGDGATALVEYGGPTDGFHRRWGWAARGCLGLVTTLRDLHEPSSFSVPDLIWDLEDMLALAGALIADEECLLVFELHVWDLMPSWSPSDRRVSAGVEGVLNEPTPCPEWRRRTSLNGTAKTSTLKSAPYTVAADLMVKALRDLYKVRLSQKRVTESLPGLRQLVREAQSR